MGVRMVCPGESTRELQSDPQILSEISKQNGFYVLLFGLVLRLMRNKNEINT